jgi:hypothetical protein
VAISIVYFFLLETKLELGNCLNDSMALEAFLVKGSQQTSGYPAGLPGKISIHSF